MKPFKERLVKPVAVQCGKALTLFNEAIYGTDIGKST